MNRVSQAGVSKLVNTHFAIQLSGRFNPQHPIYLGVLAHPCVIPALRRQREDN